MKFCGHKKQGTAREQKRRDKIFFLGPSTEGTGKYIWGPARAKHGCWLDQSWYFDLIKEMMSTPPEKEMISPSTMTIPGQGKE